MRRIASFGALAHRRRACNLSTVDAWRCGCGACCALFSLFATASARIKIFRINKQRRWLSSTGVVNGQTKQGTNGKSAAGDEWSMAWRGVISSINVGGWWRRRTSVRVFRTAHYAPRLTWDCAPLSSCHLPLRTSRAPPLVRLRAASCRALPLARIVSRPQQRGLAFR